MKQTHLCETIADLFVLSARRGYDSNAFIETYMNSDVAIRYDSEYAHEQWSGEEYILEELEDNPIPKGETWDEYTLYWTGYLYQYWHLTRNVSSKDIYKIADAKTMYDAYPGYHTVDFELAIEWLIEIS